MEQKHTPGPWEAGLGDNDGRDFITIEHDGCPICNVRGTDDMSCLDDEDEPAIAAEVVANAKLIAAAPDLLEACHKLMEANAIMAKYIVDNDTEFTVDTGMHAYTLASNAIKKATE